MHDMCIREEKAGSGARAVPHVLEMLRCLRRPASGTTFLCVPARKLTHVKFYQLRTAAGIIVSAFEKSSKRRAILTKKEAKDYLGQLQRGRARLDRMRDEVTRLRSAAAGTGSGLNSSGIRTSPDTDRMARNVEKALQAEQVLQNMAYEYWKQRVHILEEIHKLQDARHIELLYLRYFDGMKLDEIRREMQKTNGCRYSFDHISHLHGEALEAFAESHDRPDA